MVTLSLCMIVKNEEAVLARCLASVAGLFEEIIIVDTGSTDKTTEIAAKFTSHVHHFAWVDDFSAARNYGFSLAQSQYCMWLDADDILLPTDKQALADLKESLDSSVQVVMLKYNTGFDAEGNVTFDYYRERIIKNHTAMCWQGAVHEVIQPIGKTIYLDIAVTHRKAHTDDAGRNLHIFENLIAKGAALDPRQQFYYGRELYYHKRYQEALQVFACFLQEKSAWLENKLDACAHCAYCYYGLQQDENALAALLQSLAYDLPRAEICCDLGKHFLDRAQYQQARFWYLQALACQRDDSRGGFCMPDCYGYIPCIQLCVCYSHLAQQEKAIYFNELAAKFRPTSPQVQHNRGYFEQENKEAATNF